MTKHNAHEQVRRLGLRFDKQDDDADDYPVVTILIDGHDQLISARSGSIGFDPDAILGDDSPLLPPGPWQRVAVYRCDCGIAECGVIAPLIVRRTDGRVVWTDFRDYTGVFDGPTLPRDPDDGRRLNQPDLVFDEDQYLAEVRRASGDRSWESARRVTARLLEAELANAADALARAGYELGWVSTTEGVEDVWQVTFRTGGRHEQVYLELGAACGAPAERAKAMRSALLATPSGDWEREFLSRWTRSES